MKTKSQFTFGELAFLLKSNLDKVPHSLRSPSKNEGHVWRRNRGLVKILRKSDLFAGFVLQFCQLLIEFSHAALGCVFNLILNMDK